jgi:hypothetical protein
MKSQLRLQFATKDEAVAYAERHGIPTSAGRKTGSAPRLIYANNFSFSRRGAWTH